MTFFTALEAGVMTTIAIVNTLTGRFSMHLMALIALHLLALMLIVRVNYFSFRCKENLAIFSKCDEIGIASMTGQTE